MPLHVFLAILAAAAMHAGWNAFLKLKIEPFLAITLVNGAAALVALPAFLYFGMPPMASWPWLGASILVHLTYYFALSAAYARADMSQIYPIARGGAPLLTATASALFLTETVNVAQGVGIAALGCGVGAMSIVGRRRGTPFDPVAILLALATAVIICGYTLSDGIGARTSGDPHAYSAALFVLDGLPLAAYAYWRRGPAGFHEIMTVRWQGLAAGAMSLGSYWIAIWAMTVAPIPIVAALRESSVLFAALIALVILKEPLQWPRALAAVLILGSLALIRVG